MNLPIRKNKNKKNNNTKQTQDKCKTKHVTQWLQTLGGWSDRRSEWWNGWHSELTMKMNRQGWRLMMMNDNHKKRMRRRKKMFLKSATFEGSGSPTSPWEKCQLVGLQSTWRRKGAPDISIQWNVVQVILITAWQSGPVLRDILFYNTLPRMHTLFHEAALLPALLTSLLHLFYFFPKEIKRRHYINYQTR